MELGTGRRLDNAAERAGTLSGIDGVPRKELAWLISQEFVAHLPSRSLGNTEERLQGLLTASICALML